MRTESRANQLEWLRRLRLQLRGSITLAGQIQHLAPRGLTAIGALPPNDGLDSSVGVNQGSGGHRILPSVDRFDSGRRTRPALDSI
jgi:hypothetical protein